MYTISDQTKGPQSDDLAGGSGLEKGTGSDSQCYGVPMHMMHISVVCGHGNIKLLHCGKIQ